MENEISLEAEGYKLRMDDLIPFAGVRNYHLRNCDQFVDIFMGDCSETARQTKRGVQFLRFYNATIILTPIILGLEHLLR